MSSQITILSYQNYQSLDHSNDYVIIYFKIEGSGDFVIVPRYSCFSLFNDVWNPMSKKQHPLNTTEPISVRGIKHGIFVWDASLDGIAIMSRKQKFQFSLYYRDISCNYSSSSDPAGIALPRTTIPPPPTITHRPVPVTRTPGTPNDPGGPGVGNQNTNINNITLDSLIIRRDNGVIVNNTPSTRERPIIDYNYLPNAQSNTALSPVQNPTRIAGKNSVRAGDNFINPLSNELLIQSNNANIVAGQGIQTPVGTLTIPIGGLPRAQTDSNQLNISPNSRTPDPLFVSPTNSLPLQEETFSSTNSALENINSLSLPIINNNGDPAPYKPKGNQFNDIVGNNEYNEYRPENFNYYNGFNKTESYTPELIKLTNVPSFSFENFAKEFIKPSIFINPREIAIGETLTISVQFLNCHDSVQEYGQIILVLSSPNNEYFEIQRTDFQLIEPDNVIACGLTINTNNLNMLGRWNVYGFLMNKYSATIAYTTEFFNLNNSNTFDGINTQYLGLTKSSTNPINTRRIVTTVQQNPVSDPLTRLPGNIITYQNIGTASPMVRIIFTNSNPTKTIAVLQGNNDISITVVSTNGVIFHTDINNGVSVIASSYGQILPYLDTSAQNYSQTSPQVIIDPNIPTNNGGIPRLTTAVGVLYIGLTPDVINIPATIVIGGNNIQVRPASAVVTRVTQTSWNIALTLPIGNEQYRYAVVGSDPLRIPSNVTWNEFNSDNQGIANISVIGNQYNYISILRLGIDGTFRPSRDEILRTLLI